MPPAIFNIHVYYFSVLVNYVFFFFQAEDGMRDWSVTGVQTCALPISAPTGAPQLAADDQQPGAEDGGGVGTLGVLEERRVHRAGAVVEGEEDDPATGPDRRGLGGHLDPRDQQLGLAAPAEQVLAAGGAERVEEGGVGVHD